MGPRVLVVEDSPTMRSYVSAALEAAGIVDVTEASSGFAALRALPGGGFDLVIADVNMPDINGLELLRYVRAHAHLARLPLICISTEGRERDRERCLTLGANAFLVKPFAPETLVAEVKRFLP